MIIKEWISQTIDKIKQKKIESKMPVHKVKLKVTYTKPVKSKKTNTVFASINSKSIIIICSVLVIVVATFAGAKVISANNKDFEPLSGKIARGMSLDKHVQKYKIPPYIDLSENTVHLESEQQRINEPTLYDNELVYSAGQAATIDELIYKKLFLYNIDTSQEQVVAETRLVNQNIIYGEIYEGRINKDWIVWMDTNQNGVHNLYVLDRSTGKSKKINSCEYNRPQLRLTGDYLIWNEQKDFEMDSLCLYNLRIEEPPASIEVFDNTSYGVCPPAVADNTLVWVYPSDNAGKSIIKKLDLTKIVNTYAAQDENSTDSNHDEDSNSSPDQLDNNSQQAEDSKTDASEEDSSELDQKEDNKENSGTDATNDESVDNEEIPEESPLDPEIIDPKGFAMYPATNGQVIAWLDDLNPENAMLKMTVDGKEIKDIACGVGAYVGVGDNFVVYSKQDSIYVYFWEIDRYGKITPDDKKGRLAPVCVNGNSVVWYDADDNSKKDDTIYITTVFQPEIEQ